MKKKNAKKGMLPYVILLVVVVFVAYIVAFGNNKVNDLTYDKLLVEIKEDQVTEMVITPHSSEGKYIITGKLKGYEEKETFKTSTPLTDSIINQIVSSNPEINYKLDTDSDPFSSPFLFILLNVYIYILSFILVNFLYILIISLIIVYMFIFHYIS